MLGNDHHDNFYAEVIIIKTLFASAKPSAIADCRGEFRGQAHFNNLSIVSILHDAEQNLIFDYNKSEWKLELFLFDPLRAWNNNTNRNNISENPLLYAQLSLKVVYC